MDFDKLTVADVRQLAGMAAAFLGNAPQAAMTDASGSAYVIGRNYLFRTVTHIVTGKLLRIHSDGLIVTDAAWIADTGRYAQAVATGSFSEVEPYPDGAEVVINATAMIDAVEINGALPRSQK